MSGPACDIVFRGGLATHGEDTDALELRGMIGSLIIEGDAGPLGDGFDCI